jgi:hypothetical protein
MDAPLAPCPGCQRHIRTRESECPFCATILPSDHAMSAVPGTTTRLTRAATFVFGATLAVAGCASTAGSGDGASSDVPRDYGNAVPPYGLPPPQDVVEDQTTPTDVPRDVPRDMGNVAPPYGIPPGDR